MQNLLRSQSARENAFVLFLYFLLAAFLSPHHRYYIHLADTFEYLVIADDYSKGFFAEAVNSYWSPLFSWLLAGFLKTGAEPFLAIQILQVLTGAVALLGIFALIPFRNDQRLLFFLFHFSFAILILSFALLVATPDLLLLTLSIWYLVLISRKDIYPGRKYSFLLLGLAGALLYFSKGAGFIFFLLSFTAVNLFLYFHADSDKRQLLIKYFSTLIVFMAVSLCWIIPISVKENKLQFSSAPAYNFNLIGPAANPQVLGEIHHPYEWNGLIAPPHAHSLNAWEEPQNLKLEHWSPLDSRANLIHYLKILLRNIWSIQAYYFGLDAGAILILGLIFLWIRKPAELRLIFSEGAVPLLIAFSCTLPYIFVLVMDRHIWINYAVLGILSVLVFNALFMYRKGVAIAFMLAFGVLICLKPVAELLGSRTDYAEIYSEREQFAKYISGNTASLSPQDDIGSINYTQSAYINYLCGSKYYGMISVPQQQTAMAEELKKNHISYLFSRSRYYRLPDSLYLEQKVFPKSRVKVYKLK